MKDKIPIRKTILPYHIDRPFGNAAKYSAKEHGYMGTFFRLRYLTRLLIDYIYQKWAKFIPVNSIRINLHRKRGVKIGKNVMIGPDVVIDDLFPNFVIIEDGVSLAGWNIILTHNKPYFYFRNVSESFAAPVRIKKNAWLASGSVILPGITVGEGSIIAVGAVVTKDVPPMVLVGGVPAKIIRDLSKELRDNYSKQEFEKIMNERKKMGFKD